MALSIGVDVGGTKIAAGVVDDDGQVLQTVRRDSPAVNRQAIVDTITTVVRRLHEDFPDAATVGIGAAGMVSSDRNTMAHGTNLDWTGMRIGDVVSEGVGLPVVVENDANAFGWAEARFGAARGKRNALIVAIGTLVTDKIVEPRLGRFEQEEGQADHRLTALTGQEAKGMKIASLVLLLLVAGLIAAAIPRASLLRNPQTGSLTTGAPLIDGIIILLALLFFVPSVLYGRISGTYKNEKDVAGQLEKNMAAMGGYIALIFVAAQFISFFNYSKLGTILAISGAEFLKSSGISGPLLMVIFVLFTSLLNLLMGSATAKWTVLAPIFIPMFMMLGYSPELTQVAYRIGDSCTNLITPMMSYFAMIVVFARKYDKKAGIGTLVSMMLPYSLFFLIGWTVLLVVWMITGLPLGPGAATLLG